MRSSLDYYSPVPRLKDPFAGDDAPVKRPYKREPTINSVLIISSSDRSFSGLLGLLHAKSRYS